MDRHGHPWGDLPGHEIDDRTDIGSAQARVPVDFEGVIVTGPAWARRLRRQAGPLLAVGRFLTRVLVVATWTALIGGWVLLATDHEDLIGLSETSTWYRPAHIAVVVVAVFAILLVGRDTVRAGRQNRAATEADIRADRERRARVREARSREDDFRRSIAVRVVVDGFNLPDDPDLRDDPNGFTGPGTQVPGAPIP